MAHIDRYWDVSFKSLTTFFSHSFSKDGEQGPVVIATGIYGLYGYAFSDFGPKWFARDLTGEQARDGIVEAISNDAEGAVVSGDSDEPHGLSDGDGEWRGG